MFEQGGAYHQPLANNFQTVRTPTQQYLNKFTTTEDNRQNLKDITCQTSITNQLISKRPLNNVQGIPQPTRTENDHLISECINKFVKQNYHSVVSSGTVYPVNIQNRVESSNTNFCQTSSRNTERPGTSKSFAQIGSDKTLKAVKQNIRKTPEIIGQRASNVTNLTSNRTTQSTARASNYNHTLILNASNLPNVITRTPSHTSTRNAPQSVRVASNHLANHGYFPGEENANESDISENNSEAAVLYNETNGNCCGRFIDFMCCRKC